MSILILATFIVQTHYTIQSLWLKSQSIKIAWSHFLVPFLSKEEMTLSIQPVTKFTLFQLCSPFSHATINCDITVPFVMLVQVIIMSIFYDGCRKLWIQHKLVNGPDCPVIQGKKRTTMFVNKVSAIIYFLSFIITLKRMLHKLQNFDCISLSACHSFVFPALLYFYLICVMQLRSVVVLVEGPLSINIYDFSEIKAKSSIVCLIKQEGPI